MMKIFNLIVFFALGFFVLGCDNVKKNNVDNVNDGSLVDLQYFIIGSLRGVLPLKVDELTTLIGVEKDKDRNALNYLYDVKNISEHELLLPSTLDTIHQAILDAYCENNEEMRKLKNAFPDGVNYHYFIANKEIFFVKLRPTDCHTK
jgi:hypothetical protein